MVSWSPFEIEKACQGNSAFETQFVKICRPAIVERRGFAVSSSGSFTDRTGLGS